MAFELFKPQFRTIQNPINLDVLASTYNTLEKGHQQAVATTAAYITALGDLPVNEAERPYIQKHINSIQETLNNEKIYGNAYAALDDIKLLGAKISTDPGIKGRIKAEADYQNYIKNLESNNKISDDTKEMYRDINKYYYEDKYDSNGNIIGGTTWQPIKREVATIPLSALVVDAIKLAGREKGTTNQTRWLDKNGKVTTNPEEAIDGETFNTATRSWERLGEEKIMQVLDGLIESTPGAKASLQQDYEVAMYKRKKYGSNPDVEDKNGITLTPDAYLLKRVKGMVQGATYNHSNVVTTYGDGLKTYKAAQKAASSAVGARPNNGISDLYGYSSHSTPITMSYDYAGNLQSVKQNSSNTIKNIYKSLSGNDLQLDLNDASTDDINKSINDAINNSNLDAVTKAKYILQGRKAIRDLEEARYNYKQIEDKIVDTDIKHKLAFVSMINGAAELDKSNPYGEKIINIVNTLMGDTGEVIRFTTDDEDVFNNVVNILNGDKKGGIKELGYNLGVDSIGNRYIDLNKNNYNQLISYYNAINASKPSLFTLQGMMHGYNISVLDKNGNVVNRKYDNSTNFKYSNEQLLVDAVSIYKNASKDVERQLSLIAPQQITIDNTNLPFESFNKQKLINMYELGIIDEKQYNIHENNLDLDLPNKIVNHNFAQSEMYSVSEENGYGTLNRRIESKDRVDIGNNIKAAVGNKRYKISAAHNPVHGTGSNITIYPTIDEEGNAKGTPQTYFIAGLLSDEASKEFESDLATKAKDKIAIGNEVGKRIMITSAVDTPSTGNQYIECLGNNQFIYNRDGQTYPVTRLGAQDIIQYMEEYQDIKDSVISGDIYNSGLSAEQLNSNISSAISLIANKIAIACGNPSDSEFLKVTLINDLTQ